ncbi:MAG: hypothetical protein IT236_17515 [Bacteroidia bacterium]|nr:hypothetical protein [Bacteroidia bacterium]
MKVLFTSVFAIITAATLSAATLVIEGKFQNKNLYVHNGFGSTGVGFCAHEIKVNGQITTDETNSSSFEIDLRGMQLEYGEKVTIEIQHSDECVPKVLNMEDLKPKPTFEVMMMGISHDGILKWEAKNESGILPYVIEQFKWNKWVRVGEVQGIGTPDMHEYTFKLLMHSGENKYRIKQKGYNSIVRTSREIVSIAALVNKPSYAIPMDFSSIDFSVETAYEVYDAYGQIVKKGFGKQINISNLGKGEFYLCYDNTLAEFHKP